MRNLAIVLTVLLGLATSAQAQTTQEFKVPGQYLKLLEHYKGWKPAYEDRQGEDYANSIFNWANHIQSVDKVLFGAVRNWVFTRSEGQLMALADVYASELRNLFGDLFIARGMHNVVGVPYTADVHGLYKGWYDCIARSDWEAMSPVEKVEERFVLSYISHAWKSSRVAGGKQQCKEALAALSAMYGVQELTADELIAIGFFSRRQNAHQNNPRFLSAEAVRKVIKKVFDPE